jgi:hypothetical protein
MEAHPMTAKTPTTTRHQPPVDETGAAEVIGCAPRTLANWRSQRRGPRFIRVGRLIRYRIEDLQAFLDAGAVEADHR